MFVLPKDFLERLNEFSSGGFVLFLIDADGDPQLYTKIDNNITALGLQKHIENWLEAVNRMNVENTEEMILGSKVIDDEDGEEEAPK